MKNIPDGGVQLEIYYMLYKIIYRFQSCNTRQIPKQPMNGTLKSCKESNEIFIKTKDYILTYKRSDQLEVMKYSDVNFVN